MAELIVGESSLSVLRQRAGTREGKVALDEFIDLIAEWSFDIMTLEMREAVSSPEGMAEFIKLWPEVVDAYFKHLSNPRGPGKTPRKRKVQNQTEGKTEK